MLWRRREISYAARRVWRRGGGGVKVSRWGAAALLMGVAGCTSAEGRPKEERLISRAADFEASYALIGAGSVTRTWRDQGELVSKDFVIDRPFYLKRHEVTVGEWTQLMGHDPSPFKGCGPDCPVVNVSWYDGIDYMNKLSIREGLRPCYEDRPCEELLGPECNERHKAECPLCEPIARRIRWRLDCDGYRYPTEAEWQLAAQGGVASGQSSYIGPLTLLGERHSPNLDTIAVYSGNSGATYEGAIPCADMTERQYHADYCGPAPVGTKQPNAYGLYDMMGNVEEWTWGERLWDTGLRQPDIVDKADGGSLTTWFSACRMFVGCSWRDTVVDCFLEGYSCNTPEVKAPVLGLRPAKNQKR
jgi:formylglycine-generating enzyme required for sulfatase activity